PGGRIGEIAAILDGRGDGSAMLAWAEAAGLDMFLEAGQSVAGNNAPAFLSLPLPGDDTTAQLERALELFDRLGAVPPPDDAIGALLEEEHAGLEATLWLLPDGVARSGIRARKPSIGLVVALAEALGGQDLDLLAQVQGLMLQDEPWAVE